MPESYIKSFPYLSKDYENPNPLPSFNQYKTPYTPQSVLNRYENQYSIGEVSNFNSQAPNAYAGPG